MPDSSGQRGLSPWLWVTCLIGLGILAGLGWLADPAADPFVGPPELEGQMLLGARGQATGETVPLGDWAPGLLVPVHTQVMGAVFRFASVGLVPARLAAAGMSLLILLVFFDLMRRAYHPGVALLACAFLVTNPIIFAIARSGYPYTVSLLGMLLTIWLWVRGARHPALNLLSGFLLVAFGLLENGPASIFFLVGGLLMLVAIRLHAWKMAWAPQTRTRLRWTALGIGLGLLLLLVQVPFRWDALTTTWGHFWESSPYLVATYIVRSPREVAELAAMMPIPTVLALGAYLFFAKEAFRPVARHRQLDEVRLWILAWITAGIPFFVVLQPPDVLTWVYVTPPLSALAADAVHRLTALRRLERPTIDVMIVAVVIAAVAWFVVASLVHSLFLQVDEGFFARHRIRSSLVLVLLLWPLVTLHLVSLYLRLKAVTVRVPPRLVGTAAVILTTIAVGMGTWQITDWWGARRYDSRDAAAALAPNVPPGTVVAGSVAPQLFLDHAARPTVIWTGVNGTPRPWQRQVGFLLLAEGRESDPELPPLSLFDGAGGRGTVGSATVEVEFHGKRLRLHPIRPR